MGHLNTMAMMEPDGGRRPAFSPRDRTAGSHWVRQGHPTAFIQESLIGHAIQMPLSIWPPLRLTCVPVRATTRRLVDDRDDLTGSPAGIAR